MPPETPDDELEESPDDVRRAPARKRVRSVVYATYVAFAVAFILLSTKSIVEGVFHRDGAPLGTSPPDSAARACADGVRSLAAALDRGVTAAFTAPDREAAKAAFRAALAPEWDGQDRLGTLCLREPRGADAFAALLRLRRAEEGFLERGIAEIAPLRRDVEAYLPR